MQGLLTNDVSKLQGPGTELMYASLLNAQGRHLHDMFLHKFNDNDNSKLIQTRLNFRNFSVAKVLILACLPCGRNAPDGLVFLSAVQMSFNTTMTSKIYHCCTPHKLSKSINFAEILWTCCRCRYKCYLSRCR